jgi:16S rRNA processing protein RimM
MKIAPTQKRFPTIRFEDMNTEEDADAIMGNDIPSTKDVAKTPVTNSTFEVIGFEVEDKRLSVVGKIESINDDLAPF